MRPNRLALGLAGGATSLFFLWLVFRRADLEPAWETLQDADLANVLLAAAIVQGVYVAQALRWRTLVGAVVSFGRFLRLVLAGVGTNNVLPLRLGDLLRARWLAARGDLPSGRALGSVVRDRAADVVVLVAMLIVTLPLAGGGRWVDNLVVAGLLLLVVIAAAVAAAALYTRRRPRERLAARNRLRWAARDTLDELSASISLVRILRVLLLSVAAWCTWALTAQVVCMALDIGVAFADVLFATAVINLGVAIPSSPGFVGTYQWLAVAALGTAGVGADSALAFALLMQAVWYVPTTLVGAPLALLEVRHDALRRRERARVALA